ncbi:efflux RND transporter periplasmic adaptor subunit [Rhodovulum sp. DZ06]|uniref:efflux RND transporter periplasmic adaptor subunit n=1 Tax=Rhodovulum sp. DZ06 TaxID=3425126 RepID=UPI003D329757
MRPLPLLMAALVCIGLYFWIVHPTDAQETGGADGPAAAEAQAQPPVKVVAFQSVARPVESALILRGRTEAHRNVSVRAETSGLVVSEPSRAGAKVSRGDLLCRIEEGSRQAQLAQARAALAQARVDNDAAQKLSERGYAAETTAMARLAQLEAATAAVRQIELDIQRLEMRAPFDGVLESDTAELGALLRAGDQCAQVIALDPIEIVGYAPETDVDKVEAGMPARARLVSGREVDGIVTFVSRAADQQTRTFRIEVSARNPDGKIRDGMTAEIWIPLQGRTAHLAPQAALTLNNAGTLGIRAAVDGKAKFMPVTILRDEAEGVWLTGLPDEVNIIYVGQEYVSDGRAIDATISTWDARG